MSIRSQMRESYFHTVKIFFLLQDDYNLLFSLGNTSQGLNVFASSKGMVA